MITITSFSYKGGAGRTVASANIAAALASRQARAAVLRPLNFKVALIDLDVFSAGMHRVFEISNEDLKGRQCVQDYLLHEIPPAEYANKGGITAADPLMLGFLARGGMACRTDFTIFPASPKADGRFTVQNYQKNNLFSLLYELEKQGFDYVIIDGESGIRQMADIAVHLADVVLMFFRLTWQHIEGSLGAMEDLLRRQVPPFCYLIPTCVPLVAEGDGVYQLEPTIAPGLDVLRKMTDVIPSLSKLNEKAAARAAATDDDLQAYGHFWAKRSCIHDSLVLKGEERVLVYDTTADKERAAADYYGIAEEISELHKAR